jgi:hypothetical protein
MRNTRPVWNPATARYVRANEQLEQDGAVAAGEGDEAVQVKPPKFPNLTGRLIRIAQRAWVSAPVMPWVMCVERAQWVSRCGVGVE